jgi:hypothetical protein
MSLGRSLLLQLDASGRRERLLLFISTCLASIVGLQVLDLGLDRPDLKLILMLVAIAGYFYSYFIGENYHRFTIIAVDVIGILAVIHYFRLMADDPFLIGNYLGMLLGVLLGLLAFIAFTTSIHRQLLLIGVVFVLFSATTSYDLLLVVYFPLFLIFTTASFYFINTIDLQEGIAHVGRDEKLRPEQAAQFTLAVGGLIIKMVVGIVAVSVIVYVLVPHYTDMNRPSFFLPSSAVLDESLEDLQRRADESLNLSAGDLATSGFSGTFDLSGSSSIFGPQSLFLSDDPALEIRSARNGYVRGTAFDVYTGQSWKRSKRTELNMRTVPMRTRRYEATPSYALPVIDFPSRHYAENELKRKDILIDKDNLYSQNEISDLNYRIFTQEVTLLKDHPPVFFSSYQPVKLESVSMIRTRDDEPVNVPPLLDDFSVPHSQLPRHPGRFTYRATILAPDVHRAQMKESLGAPPPVIVDRYTGLPIASKIARYQSEVGAGVNVLPVPEEVFREADRVVAGATTPYDKVLAIYSYLKDTDRFAYTLEFPELNEYQEATSYLLFTSRAGFCQQFASAMAVLCRTQNIPARVVTGYAPGSYSVIGNKYVYRDRNAHAWVEVYFDGLGWVMFDPTPASSDLFSLSRIREMGSNTVGFMENLFVIDPAGARETIVSFFVGLYNLVGPALATRWYLVVLVLGTAILLGVAVWRLRRGFRRKSFFVPENELVREYIALSDALAASSLLRYPSDTHKENLDRVVGFLGEYGGDLRRFISLYEDSAFSPRQPGVDDARWARQFVELVRRLVEQKMRGNGKP